MQEEKEKSKTPLSDMMEEATVGTFVKSVLPSVTPMLDPLSKKLDDYLGNNDKIIIIRRASEKSPATVLVLDTNKVFEISRKRNEDGECEKFKFTMELNSEKKPDALLKYFDTKEFVTDLLSGKFTKEDELPDGVK